MQICFALVVSTPAQRNLFGDVFVGVLPQQSDSHGWPQCVHGDFRPGQKCNVVAGSRSNRFIGMSPANCSAGSF